MIAKDKVVSPNAQREVRCPRCGKKYGEHFDGLYVGFCEECQKLYVLDSRLDNQVKTC